MTLALRVFLLVCAVVVLVFVIRKIKKSEFETMDAIFWLLFTVVIALLAIFPDIAYTLSGVLGFESPSNFVFLCVIAILLIRVFSLNAKVAHLRAKTNSLIQEIALREQEANSD